MASDRDILKVLGQRTAESRRNFGRERSFAVTPDNYSAIHSKTGKAVSAAKTAPSHVQKRAFVDLEGGVTAALRDPESGQMGRGRAHFLAGEDLGKKLGVSGEDAIDRAYMQDNVEAQGFSRGSEGKFGTRADEARLAQRRKLELADYELGDSEIRSQAESHAVQVRERDRSAVDKRRSYRAHSDDQIEQSRRQVRARAAHEGVGKINSEIKELAASNPEQSSGKSHRLQQLVKRKGLLQSLAKRAGIMGIASTPFATFENIKGLFSADENQVSKSVGELTGMPDVFPRGMTEQEKDDRPIWHDSTTGEFKI